MSRNTAWTRTNHRRYSSESTPPPPPPSGDPTSAWTKAQIVAWLADHGVVVDKKAQANLSKGELLDMVADVLSPEVTG